MVPHAVESSRHRTWFIPQPFAKGYFLCPHGLEVLVDQGSTDVQDWRGEQLGHKGRFYNNSEQWFRNAQMERWAQWSLRIHCPRLNFPCLSARLALKESSPMLPATSYNRALGSTDTRASPSIYSPPLGHRSLMCSLR